MYFRDHGGDEYSSRVEAFPIFPGTVTAYLLVSGKPDTFFSKKEI